MRSCLLRSSVLHLVSGLAPPRFTTTRLVSCALPRRLRLHINGRSLFQPITRPLAFSRIFEASPHTCKTEENPTRSSWLMTAAPMPRPPLLRPRLLQPQKFSCSRPPAPRKRGRRTTRDASRRRTTTTVCRCGRCHSNSGTRPARTGRGERSRRDHRIARTRFSVARLCSPGQLLSNYFKRPVQFSLAAERPQRNHRHAMRIQAVPPSGGSRPLWGLLIDGYGFDLELLYVAQQRGYRIAEIPVNWSHQHGSRFRVVRDGLAMLRELAVIRRNAAKGYYSSPSHPRNFHPVTDRGALKYETGEKSATLKMDKSIASCMNRRITFEVPETSNPRPSRCSRYSRSSRQFSRTLIVIPQPASPHPDDCA